MSAITTVGPFHEIPRDEIFSQERHPDIDYCNRVIDGLVEAGVRVNLPPAPSESNWDSNLDYCNRVINSLLEQRATLASEESDAIWDQSVQAIHKQIDTLVEQGVRLLPEEIEALWDTPNTGSYQEVLPINYSALAEDILSGLGRRSLESKSRLGEYSGGLEIITQIGTNPLSQYELGTRDNWALKDRLDNFDAIVEQLFDDYQVTDLHGRPYVLENNAETLMEEISALENTLKNFDVSHQRLKKVKNGDLVQSKYTAILDKLHEKKQTVAKQYGLEFIDSQQVDYNALVKDVLAGKPARYLHTEYGMITAKNHAWEDRLENLNTLFDSEIEDYVKHNENREEHSLISRNRLKKMTSAFVDGFKGLNSQKKEYITKYVDTSTFSRFQRYF